MAAAVTVSRQSLELPTYLPHAPDRNPMFLDRRVYQGSSGKVYPLPVIDRVAATPTLRRWDAVELENEFLSVLILPEIGGRIHAVRDKTNGYDLVYRQEVIKPALVGLAGPWASGGIEFNWPQHHRPSTFLPADVQIERHDDGAITVWLSEHEPMHRLKGMHGVCLRPGIARLELKARVYNRTPLPRTFLWWANVATRVHGEYQSFFPSDIRAVADHAKRAVTSFPRANTAYYGVDYPARARAAAGLAAEDRRYQPPVGTPADDLSWYANIPVPTSYMAVGSRHDFFGGYDHRARAGILHVANHHIVPGKKQWTWGNHAFGYAWDHLLTDADKSGEHRPYIELMAGAFTDNQPDFSFLQPGETKTWTQYWAPLREIGVPTSANAEAAVHLRRERDQLVVGLNTFALHVDAIVEVDLGNERALRRKITVGPDAPQTLRFALPRRSSAILQVRCRTAAGRELIMTSTAPEKGQPPPASATEPPVPERMASADQLFLTGVHLQQYRHPTRSPLPYWHEALRRDPGDSRVHTALGKWHLERGEWLQAIDHLRRAVDRLTERNPNPSDGEAHYTLGLALRHELDRLPGTAQSLSTHPLFADAYAALYKATWNQAWKSAAYFALAEMDCRRTAWRDAIAHLEICLRHNADQLGARALLALVHRQSGESRRGDQLLRDNLALDPHDALSAFLLGKKIRRADQQLDVARDLARAGFHQLAAEALALAARAPAPGTAPLVFFHAARQAERLGNDSAAAKFFRAAERASPDYCFPSLIEDLAVLEQAIEARPDSARAHYYLGNFYYDRGRRAEARGSWQLACRLDPAFPTAWRNLGLAEFNLNGNAAAARRAYHRAFAADPRDARILYEQDQLGKRLGDSPRKRLRQLERNPALLPQRDDLLLEYCSLLNLADSPAKAQEILATRHFQPWEGGEGVALGLHRQTHLQLGREAFSRGDYREAATAFAAAQSSPANLGEARHFLVNDAEVQYWSGIAHAALGEKATAKTHWEKAAAQRGDFLEMRPQAITEATFFSALALARLNRRSPAKKMLEAMLARSRELEQSRAQIDYFATSLPNMLLFEDDLQLRQQNAARVLAAQALTGLAQPGAARPLLRQVLRHDPAHVRANEFWQATHRSISHSYHLAS